jgi:tRNA A37 N6-isopentenylltransferase MiaA
MAPVLHLVLGSTGLGKTDVATALAAEHGNCAVISLDRFQGYPEIAIGSGRPAPDASGPPRLYLYDGTFADGPMTASACAERFRVMTRAFRENEAEALVAEGGSISLVSHIAANPDCFDGWAVTVTVCTASSARQHEARIARRVATMLGAGQGTAGARTLLHELSELWDDPRARAHASEVVGYREAIDICQAERIPPRDLVSRRWRHRLAHSITAGHHTYAGQQHRALTAVLPALTQLAHTVSYETA